MWWWRSEIRKIDQAELVDKRLRVSFLDERLTTYMGWVLERSCWQIHLPFWFPEALVRF